jgi:hypothetical protein
MNEWMNHVISAKCRTTGPTAGHNVNTEQDSMLLREVQGTSLRSHSGIYKGLSKIMKISIRRLCVSVQRTKHLQHTNQKHDCLKPTLSCEKYCYEHARWIIYDKRRDWSFWHVPPLLSHRNYVTPPLVLLCNDTHRPRGVALQRATSPPPAHLRLALKPSDCLESIFNCRKHFELDFTSRNRNLFMILAQMSYRWQSVVFTNVIAFKNKLSKIKQILQPKKKFQIRLEN